MRKFNCKTLAEAAVPATTVALTASLILPYCWACSPATGAALHASHLSLRKGGAC